MSPLDESVALGISSRDAKALALGHGGSFLAPDEIIRKFAGLSKKFMETFLSFVDILSQDETSIEYFDEFVQTWDESNDFLYDFEALIRGAPFSKRQPPAPIQEAFITRNEATKSVSYKLARYLYTDKEIDRLRRRINLQTHIMHAKLDDILINSYLDVIPTLESNVKRGQSANGLQLPKDCDDNTLKLYEHLARFANRSKRTSYAQSQAQVGTQSQNLNPEDLDYILKILKARFERHQFDQVTVSPDFLGKQDIHSLQEFSLEKLKNLFKKYRNFRSEAPNITRKRIYARDGRQYGAGNIEFSLPGPALPLESQTTIKIAGGEELSLRSVDVVSYNGLLIVVSCLEGEGHKAMIHYLPQTPSIYPFSFHHEKFVHGKCATEVIMKSKCTVEECTESYVLNPHHNSDPRYKLSSIQDSMSFQSALRNKYLQASFEVETIASDRGKRDMIVFQVLNLWTDFTGTSGSITFFRHTTDREEANLEFLLTDFAFPFETKEGRNDSIRMKFNRAASPRIIQPKRNSTTMRRPSWLTISLSSSFTRSAARNNSGDLNSIFLFAPLGSLPMTATSSPATGAQTPNSGTSSYSEGPTTSTLGKPASTVSRYAKSLGHLDIQFSSLEGMKTFKAICRKVHKLSIKSDSLPSRHYPIYSSETELTSSPFGPLPLLPSPTGIGFEEDEAGYTDNNLQDLIRAQYNDPGQSNQTIYSFKTPSKDERAQHRAPKTGYTDNNLQDLIRAQYNDPGQSNQTIYSFETPSKDERAQHRAPKTPSPPISPTFKGPTNSTPTIPKARSDIVFRIRGIRDDFSIDQTKNILREILGVGDKTNINVRSLASDESVGQKVAVVSLIPTPECFAGNVKEWDSSKLTEGKVPGLTIDNHFHGLTVLHAAAKSEHKFDICAVAGLAGHAFGSFKERGGSWMWILDLLPLKFPSARIMTYGFDTKLHGSVSTQGLMSLGSELRSTMEDLIGNSRNKEVDESSKPRSETEIDQIKPVIFIAHSLGGLIVREAMIDAKWLDSPLLKVFHGALFFGVPNQGMNNGALCSVVKDQANMAMIGNLGKESDLLTKETKQFDEIVSSLTLDMIYFYEEQLSSELEFDATSGTWKANGKKIFMVDRSSATNGLWTKNALAAFGFNRNHSDLVKYGRSDPELTRTVRQLEGMVDRAMKRAAKVPFITPLLRGMSVGTGFSSSSRAATGFENRS